MPKSFMRAAMDSDAATQPVSFGVDRPVFFVAQMTFETGGRQHDAAEIQFGHRAAHFLHGFLRLLQRNQRQTLETRALLQVGIGEPVVPGARHVDGELPRNHFAKS